MGVFANSEALRVPSQYTSSTHIFNLIALGEIVVFLYQVSFKHLTISLTTFQIAKIICVLQFSSLHLHIEGFFLQTSRPPRVSPNHSFSFYVSRVCSLLALRASRPSLSGKKSPEPGHVSSASCCVTAFPTPKRKLPPNCDNNSFSGSLESLNPKMDSQLVPEMDYRSRFKDFLTLEEQRNGLVEVCP
jgi:hypothetical protein